MQVSTVVASCWQPNPSCGGKVAILVAMALTDLHRFGAADQRPLFFGHRMRQVRLA
jgi:hypothetical protein